jgi:hypothetical protein
MGRRDIALQWVWLAGLMLAAAGYWGAWISHRTAGLMIQGYDLAEYVKFLPEVRAGSLPTWREWFVLPAAALSLAFTLSAAQRRWALRWFIGGPLLLIGLACALTLLPPAWTPALLMTAEFRLQTLLLAGCLGIMILSPLLRRLSVAPLMAGLALIVAASVAGAARQFAVLKPAIDHVYGGSATVGWGAPASIAGALVLLAAACAALAAAFGWTRRGAT